MPGGRVARRILVWIGAFLSAFALSELVLLSLGRGFGARGASALIGITGRPARVLRVYREEGRYVIPYRAEGGGVEEMLLDLADYDRFADKVWLTLVLAAGGWTARRRLWTGAAGVGVLWCVLSGSLYLDILAVAGGSPDARAISAFRTDHWTAFRQFAVGSALPVLMFLALRAGGGGAGAPGAAAPPGASSPGSLPRSASRGRDRAGRGGSPG